MDWSHLRLHRQPFRPAVDADSYYPTLSHESALAMIAAGFARRESVVLIDGAPGVGKTLVARKWLEHLLPDVPRVILPNACATEPAELLQAMLFDLGESYKGHSEQELRLAVTDSLLAAASASGYPTVLVLDEAQHLSQAALEELRMLGNLETRRGVALFTVLIAHPMLREALRRPAYELFAQRIGGQAKIDAFTAEESVGYLHHQVRAAGGEPDKVFTEEAIALIAASCAGVPRVLNRVATLTMELAGDCEGNAADFEAALEALDQLGMEPVETEDAAELPGPVLLLHPGRSSEAEHDQVVSGRGSKDKSPRKRMA